MKKVTSLKVAYIIIGFLIGFLVPILIIASSFAIYDINLNKPFFSISHFIIPLLFGIISSVVAYLLGKRRSEQKETARYVKENFKVLFNVNYSLLTSIDLNIVLQTIIDISTELINLDTGAIYLYSQEKLYLGATTPPLPNDFPDFLRHDMVSNHPNIKNSLESKKHLVITDTSKVLLSESEQAIVKARNLRSILYIPLVIENRSVGIMILGTTKTLRKFSQNEIDLYSSFTGQAALSIENAKLYSETATLNEELSQNVEELMAMNEKLKETNARIEEMNEELTAAKEKAEESDRLKSSFLQNMSHEIRTPLNSIVGFSERINNPNLIAEKRKLYTDIIKTSSFQLLSVISDILTISSLETNQEKLNIENRDINNVLDELKELFNLQAKKKNIELKVAKQLNSNESRISIDFCKLNQIFSNLISNAIKFTSNGYVEFGYEKNGNNLRFFVKDSGIGIEESKHEVIFNRFVQANESITVDYGGTGLGLSICKGLIELLGGTISVESELGIGSTFTFTIPYTPYLTDNKVSAKIQSVAESQNKTILVAEDQEYNFIYLKVMLHDLNYQVIYAQDGQQAVDICKENPSISLVLMDIKMPVLDGYNAAKIIREFKPNLPIVAQTAYATAHEIEKYSGVFDDYITKPIIKERIVEVLDKFLR
jgi:signal transduction histidine kinase/CheY-like chemotaxis protein